MLDNRKISNKHNNPNNDRTVSDLNKRNLNFYSDETASTFLGFNKLIYHPEKLVGLKTKQNIFPVTATLSLGNYCNHGCLWCSTAYFRKSDATKINFQKILNWIQSASKRGLAGIGYVGNGEPLAYNKFGELATKIGELGLNQGIFTNGYLIDRYKDILIKYFTYIRISLDAGTSEIHSWLHDVKNNHFDKIILNLENLIKDRKEKKPTIGVQFATHQHNINDLLKCAKITKEIGVDYLSIKPVFDRGSVKDKIEKNTLKKEDFDRAYNEILHLADDNFKIFYRPQQIIAEENEQNMLVYKKCYASFFGINIYENGDITGCGPHHELVGNLDTPLDQIEDNILKLIDKLDLVKCPSGCRYHGLNYLLHKIMNKEDFEHSDHLNLI